MKTILLCALLVGSAEAATVPLGLTQAQAFPALGHLCGNIYVYPTATGFDASGNPQAAVYLKTSCSGGGRGSHATIYATWVQATWDLGGNLISLEPAEAVTPSTTVFTFGPYTLQSGHVYVPPMYQWNYYPIVLTAP